MSDSPPASCPRCGADRLLTDAPGICAACLARGVLSLGADWPLPAAEPDPLPEVPGWRLLHLTGTGGMGQVYEAVSLADGTPGAVKILDSRWTDDPVMAARFEGEAEAMRRLEHPNIVRLTDVPLTSDGRLCLVMEWVDGCDLGRLLRAEKLTHERAMDIFRKVCDATAHAHAQGFVHRDIKPSNILAGRNGTVKLADFGLAKAIGDDPAAASPAHGLTATTDQFGTAYYLAPERMLSGKNCGPEADVYSLGVLLYHLLTGRMPLGKYQSLAKLEGWPPRIDAVLAAALEADPAQRTPDVATLRDAVEVAWKQHCSGAHRHRRRRQMLLGVGGILLLAAAAAGGALWQWTKHQPAPPIIFRAPSTATAGSPWLNSLGMAFVPVPNHSVLFSIHETRRREFGIFRAAVSQAMSHAWMADNVQRLRARSESILRVDNEGTLSFDGTWENPGFPVTPEHPAVGIGIREAQRFCLWLTEVEQKEKRLLPHQKYRLPTNAEWLAACGGRFARRAPGNVAGAEAKDETWPDALPILPSRDPFPRAAPVGSFPPERFGLYDISGNVSEWVLDGDESTAERDTLSKAQLRGPSFRDGSPETLGFQYLHKPLRAARLSYVGFRIVLDHDFPPPPAPPSPPPSPPSSSTPPSTPIPAAAPEVDATSNPDP